MTRYSAGQLVLTVGGSAALWLLLAVFCLMVGSTGFGWPADPYTYLLRRELVLVSSLVGAGLAASGVVYQAILRNPLADPYLLGVSTGASLFAYVWQFQFTTALLSVPLVGALGQQAFAFVGAAASIAVVFAIASRRGRLEPVTLILVGVIVNAINASIFLLINALLKDPATSGGPLTFLVGGIQTNLQSHQVWTALACIAAGWIVLLYVAGQLNVAGLDEAEAESLGVRIHRLRWVGLVVASLVAASAVAISGPIGFVGLICPHLGRLIVGNDQRKLLPVATALGAGLLAVADAFSRWLSDFHAVGTVLPVGVLTALLGGPFFLFLLLRRRGHFGA